MLKLKDVIEKMEEIEDSPEFDGWEAWIQLKDWLVQQKPPEADGITCPRCGNPESAHLRPGLCFRRP